jgi:GNAT superfamily N-acetyltransferase
MDPTKATLKLRVSIAKQSDRPLIGRLLRRAVGRSDYVFRILPRLLERRTLFLAWDGDALVGMTNFDRCIDGSGWLSVARTDPDWRGRGVATLLQHEIAAYAKRRSIEVLRLWALSNNKSSLRACARGGFKQVCEAALVYHTLRPAKTHRKIHASHPSEEELLPLLKSSYVAKMQGYVGHRRHFLKFTKKLLTRLRNEDELYITEDYALLVTQPETTFRARQSSLTILEGPFAESLNAAKTIASQLGARILSSYIPYRPYEISVARKHGFRRRQWSTHCLVFEKRISHTHRTALRSRSSA